MKIALHTLLYTVLLVLGLDFGTLAQQYDWVRSYPLDYNMNPAMIQTATTTDGDNCVYLWSMRGFHNTYGSTAFGNLALSKYDISGNEIYSKTIYGLGNVITMKDDGQKYIYLLGSMRSNLNFWNSSIMGCGGVGETEYFLVRISPQGEPELMLNIDGLFRSPVYNVSTFSFNGQGNILLGWASSSRSFITEISIEGDSLSSIIQENVPLVSSITTNPSGEIFVAGSCASPGAVFAGVAYEPEAGYNRYIAKYNPDGEVLWVNYVEDITCNFPVVQCDNNGNVYYSDLLHLETQFGNHTTNGPQWVYDYFLAKLDGDGEYQWVKEIPLQSQVSGDASLGGRHSLLVDNMGNPILCGFQRGIIDWGNGILSEAELYYDYFIIKYGPDGAEQWIKNGGGSGYDTYHELAFSDDGSIYASGIAHDTIQLDGITHYEEGWLYPVLVKVTDGVTSAGASPMILDDSQMSLYPNPASGSLNIRYRLQDAGYRMIQMYSISGKKIQDIIEEEMMPGVFETEINVSKLPSGVYFIRAQSATQIITQKLIIE